jgi:peptidoglycan/xylan/chitin deacetylase (PgdA/CDA1 family)
MRGSAALLTGCLALGAAAALALTAPRWSWAPLALFVTLCLVAPFLPRASFFLRIISRGPRRCGAVALTFDDGPEPRTTPLLAEVLERHGARATFFVVGRQVRRHGDLLARLLQGGHEIGNHTDSHDGLLMLRSTRRIAAEIDGCQETLRQAGVEARYLRPPVGIVNPRIGPLLARRGLECVTFSCRAGDRGNRVLGSLARRVLRRVRPGHIVLLHDCVGHARFDVQRWLDEIEQIISGLEQAGLRMVTLSQLLTSPQDLNGRF